MYVFANLGCKGINEIRISSSFPCFSIYGSYRISDMSHVTLTLKLMHIMSDSFYCYWIYKRSSFLTCCIPLGNMYFTHERIFVFAIEKYFYHYHCGHVFFQLFRKHEIQQILYKNKFQCAMLYVECTMKNK